LPLLLRPALYTPSNKRREAMEAAAGSAAARKKFTLLKNQLLNAQPKNKLSFCKKQQSGYEPLCF